MSDDTHANAKSDDTTLLPFVKRVSAPSRLRVSASHIWSAALDLLFPPRCAACKRRGSWLCGRCLSQVQMLRPPLCPHCGQGLPAGAACSGCAQRRPEIGGLRAAAYLEGPLRAAVHSFKYDGVRQLAGPLAGILYEGYRRHRPPADVLVAVPLHRTRHNWRGFNQSLLLAQALGERERLPVVSGLARVRETPSQVGLSARQRYANVENAFAWTGRPLAGERILLIDDVCTTGATLEACAVALRQAGASSVWGLTLAREGWEHAP